MKILKVLCIGLFILIMNLTSIAQNKRGLWLWNSSTVVPSANETNILINQCKIDNITEIYLYAYTRLNSAAKRTQMRTFISKANCNNINVWAMDGYRAYFDDWDGPAFFNNFINEVITYNAGSAANERFIGIHGDNEPQDGQSEPLSSFHNGTKSSSLSTVPGSGVWQSTEALDREFLMRSWCNLTEATATTCHSNGMLYGIDAPSWPDDYYGEPIICTYNAVTKNVLEHLMDYVDSYCIMTYNTNPANAANRGVGELTYAGTMPLANRPEVWVAVETHCGPGNTISYCDTPGKNSKAVVNTDMATITTALSAYPALTGINIHDWAVTGWKEMPTASTNITDPGCVLPITLTSFIGENRSNKNYLSWTTSSEINFSHYEVEFSTDGINFTTLDIVEQNDQITNFNKYHYAHDFLGSEIQYYRLKSIDLDNTYEYSSIIKISAPLNTITIYPSPAESVININISKDPAELKSIEIMDTRGIQIMHQTFHSNMSQSIPIDIANLVQGIYFIKVNSNTTDTTIMKFIKK